MQRLHNKVMFWAAENLNDGKYQAFRAALDGKHFDRAHQVLMEEFYANQRVTIWWRGKFRQWLENFGLGFVPI